MKNKHKNVANKIFLKVEKLISKKGRFSILSLSSLREDKHTFLGFNKSINIYEKIFIKNPQKFKEI